jgi:predicted TPR repeat methyltransferase
MDKRDGSLFSLMVRLASRRQQDALQRATALQRQFVDARNKVETASVLCGKRSEAADLYLRAVSVARGSREALAVAYQGHGELDKAAEIYRAWLNEEPDNPVARHHLAACTGTDVPARAAEQYVEHTFDRFAETFDARLSELHYRAPEFLAEAIGAIYGAPGKTLEVLDAGCGTGLCGPLIAGYARRLVGVDLSGEMLAKARARGMYDELHKAELTAFLAAARGEYDMIISADTLCYFGELTGVSTAAYGALRSDGCLAFTVEALDDFAASGHRIEWHGRYAHARVRRGNFHRRGICRVIRAAAEPAIGPRPAGKRARGDLP